MLSLIKHLGASVFGVMSHLLKRVRTFGVGGAEGGSRGRQKKKQCGGGIATFEERRSIFFLEDVGICIRLDCDQKPKEKKLLLLGDP